MLKLDTRRHERIVAGSLVKLRWRGSAGETHFARAKVLNWSESGVCVELTEPIQLRCYVTLDAPDLYQADWAAGGAVRHCASKGAKYVVGLELTAGIKRTEAAGRHE
jgi:hypothetical protein